MAYKEKDTKKWTAQWFETNAKGEKKKRRKRGFSTKKEALEYERQKKLNSSRSMDMKLSEFMEVYFEDKQNELKERTMKNKYCIHLNEDNYDLHSAFLYMFYADVKSREEVIKDAEAYLAEYMSIEGEEACSDKFKNHYKMTYCDNILDLQYAN